MKSKSCLHVLLIIFVFIRPLYSQNIIPQIGISYTFSTDSLNSTYENPSLHLKIEHDITPRIKYIVEYYNFLSVLSSFEAHSFVVGEYVLSREFKGGEITIDLLSPFMKINNLFLGAGPSYRGTTEILCTSCNSVPWGSGLECHFSSILNYNWGLNLLAGYNFFFWRNFGIGLDANYRLFAEGFNYYSLSAGLEYKIQYSDSKYEEN